MPIQLKRYLQSYWTSNNPILKSGELGIEEVSSGIYRFKLGTEYTAWNSLSYPVVFTVGDNSLSGIQNFNSGILNNSVLSNYAEKVQDVSISSNVLNLNLSSGNVFRTFLSSNITGINIQSIYPSGNLHSLTLIMNYNSGAMAVSWPSSIYWNGGSGSVPVLGSGIGRSAIISLATTNGGSTYFGFLGGNNFGV